MKKVPVCSEKLVLYFSNIMVVFDHIESYFYNTKWLFPLIFKYS